MAIKFWLRILLNGLALAALDIGGVLFGFGVYTLVRPADQIAVQAPVAAAAVVAGMVGMVWLLNRASYGELVLQNPREALWVYLLALAWAPVVFIPLHYLGSGYLTSAGNLIGLALFQLPANALALWAAGRLVRGRRTDQPEARNRKNPSAPGV